MQQKTKPPERESGDSFLFLFCQKEFRIHPKINFKSVGDHKLYRLMQPSVKFLNYFYSLEPRAIFGKVRIL